MNWLQKRSLFRRRLWLKTANLNGEWFIDDSGQATFADGDIGDFNHESYALQSKIPEELYERYENGKLTKRQRAEIGEEFLQYMEHGGEARDWMVEREGWIRVQGTNFELYELSEAQLDHIISFVGEELGSWDAEDIEDFDIYINELSTGRDYEFSVQQLFTAAQQQGGVARIVLRGKQDPVALNRQQEHDQEFNQVIQENNRRMEEGLRLITQLRSTLGDDRYSYIANKLSRVVPGIQLSILYDLSRVVLSLSTMNDQQYQQQVDSITSPYFSAVQ